jgi:hypothetical protein
MAARDWRCPACRTPLGRLVTDRQRGPVLTLTRQAARLDAVAVGYLVTCQCGGTRLAVNVQVRTPFVLR